MLTELQKKISYSNVEIWTEKVDVCYEVLTSHTSFYGYVKSGWERVIDKVRPHLPDYIDPKLQEFVERCWHKNPSNRPTLEVIVNEFEKHLKELGYPNENNLFSY